MSNSINPRPLEPIVNAPIVDSQGNATPYFARLLRDLVTRADKVLTNLGQVQSSAPVTGRTEGLGVTVSGLATTGDIKAATKVVGRTEGIGTTVQQLNATGQLLSTDQIAADGTGSPLTGGKRGFVALDTNNKLASSFHGTTVNLSNVPNSSTTLSNDGSTTVITISAATDSFAAGDISDNSGTVDPGSFGTFVIYHDDPTPSGGAVTYVSTTSAAAQVQAEGRVIDGKITTVSGSAKTGGGNTGGTTSGGGGGRGYILPA